MLNNTEYKVSVILPAYNAEKYIDEAIKSILLQSFTDYEFIIINDGSTDNTLKIIESFQSQDKRIKVINRENKGLVYSLNEGISVAKGEYIARMDADDISEIARLEEQVALLDSGADICGCHYEEIDDNGSVISIKKVPLNSSAIILCLGRTVPFAHGSVMFKKAKFQKYGLRYGMTTYSKAEDYALWCEMYNKSFVFKNVDSFLFKYRNIEGTLTSNKQHLLDSASISLAFIKSNYNKLQDCIHVSSDMKDFFVIKNYVILVLLLTFRRKNVFYLFEQLKFKFFYKALKMYISVITKAISNQIRFK